MVNHLVSGDSYQLELDGSLMVGGIGMVVDNAAIPSGLWSATLRHGYVGCMRDLVINGNAVDLAAFARQQDSGDSTLIAMLFRPIFFGHIAMQIHRKSMFSKKPND